MVATRRPAAHRLSQLARLLKAAALQRQDDGALYRSQSRAILLESLMVAAVVG